MQQRLLAVLLLLALLASACGSGGDETSSTSDAEQTNEQPAEADVVGAADGCGAALAYVNALDAIDSTDELEAIAESVQLSEELLEDLDGEFDGMRTLVDGLRDTFARVLEIGEREEDPNNPSEEAQMELLEVLITFQFEFAEPAMAAGDELLEICGTNYLSESSGFFGGLGSGDQSATAAATSTSTTTTTEAPPPVAETIVETSSVGAAGSYINVTYEVGEIWRTNQLPEDAIAGVGNGTDESWVLVEIRGTNDSNADLSFFGGDITWLDANGDAVPAWNTLTPEGEQWQGNFPTSSSERGFVVFPGPLGESEMSVLRFGGGEVEPLDLPLGQGELTQPYPVDVASGATGTASVAPTAACSYTADTEVHEAQIVLNTNTGNRWEQAPEGRRYFIVDLAVSVRPADNPAGCLNGFSLFQLESRLESDNGDRVASTDMNFDNADENSTTVDRLTFEIADDVTSLTLLGQNGEELARWDDLNLPEAQLDAG